MGVAWTVSKTNWGLIFFGGAILFGWLEWRNPDMASSWLWFMETSLWSAFCGIGYSIGEWFGHKNK